jgi:hypothetical protein
LILESHTIEVLFSEWLLITPSFWPVRKIDQKFP